MYRRVLLMVLQCCRLQDATPSWNTCLLPAQLCIHALSVWKYVSCRTRTCTNNALLNRVFDEHDWCHRRCRHLNLNILPVISKPIEGCMRHIGRDVVPACQRRLLAKIAPANPASAAL